MGQVNTTTILDITRNAAYRQPKSSPPDLKSIFNQKAGRAEIIIDFQKATRPTHAQKMRVTQKDIADANQALKDIPEGFRLQKLIYTRVSQDQNKEVYKEFRDVVRPRFMRFLAENHAEDLKTLGICDYGIKRMSQGIDPCDKDGRLYDISVDHVIERAGGGRLSYEKAEDADLKKLCEDDEFQTTYKINHFDNLMLLPNEVHFKRKNAINDIQQLHRGLDENESVWGMMIIPVRSANSGEYVYRPLPDRQKDFGVKKRKMTFETHVSHTHYLLQQLDEAMKGFYSDPYVKKIYIQLQQAAKDNNVRLVQYWEKDGPSERQSNNVRDIFHSSLKLSTRDMQQEYKRILGLSDEVYRNLNAAVKMLEDVKNPDEKYVLRLERLQRMVDGPVQKVLPRLRNIPAQSDGSAARIVQRTDGRLAALNRIASTVKAGNDNQKPFGKKQSGARPPKIKKG